MTLGRRALLFGTLASVALSASPASAGLRISGMPHHRRPATDHHHGHAPDSPAEADAVPGGWRLGMVSSKSGEHLDLTVDRSGMAESQRQAVRHFFRDQDDRDATHPIPDRLIAGLADLQRRAGGRRLVLYSGFRTALTNSRKPGTVKNSLHMQGEAADISIDGYGESELFHLAAVTASQTIRGGCGLYRGQGFAHLDIGSERQWSV